MPLRETVPPSRTTKEEALLRDLVAELHTPKDRGQPWITIAKMRQGAVHVHVIWDRWEDCRGEERSDIILDAMEQTRGKQFRDAILLAIGVTTPEAAELGLLPYGIAVYNRKKLPPEMQERCKAAMRDEGASILGNPEWPLLRFGTREEAVAAKKRLEQRVPEADWDVTQTVMGPDSLLEF